MKKFLKFIGNFIFAVIAIGLTAYIICMHFFPERIKELTGYQTFVILTDSMEPVIPVGSLVIDRMIEKGEEIPEDTIISFQVNRLDEEVVFTHYLKKKELDETGKVRYYTQAENADRYDDYETYEEDVLGVYMAHIPYVGKFVLFLQSPFALLELGIIAIIMVIYNILWLKFDKEEKAVLEARQEDDTADDTAENILVQEELGSDGEPEEVKEELVKEELVKEELVPEMIAEPGSNILFGYQTTPSSSAFNSGNDGFSFRLYLDGSIQCEVPGLKKQEERLNIYTLDKKNVKRIKKILKENSLIIQNLPETLDNGFCVGTCNFFIFKGKKVHSWNIKYHDIKKVKAKNYTYYKKYKKTMKNENDVLDIFKQIRKILKDEGIRLKIDALKIKETK